MFEQATEPVARNTVANRIVGAGIGLVFIVFGSEKFGASWVSFFDQVGWGQWFRYVTGVVEILGGLLLFAPWTFTAGIALLSCTMFCAGLIHIFVLGHPADCIIPFAFLAGLLAFWNSRRNR